MRTGKEKFSVSTSIGGMASESVAKFAGLSFTQFMDELIVRFGKLNKYRAVEAYRSALNSFTRFCVGRDIPLGEISTDMMKEYEAWLTGRGVAMNTVSFYCRILRAAYNRAVEGGLVVQCYPFRHVYTGIDRTVKRAVPLASIRRIKYLDLSSHPGMGFARDMFMFSFYTRGMSFIDMAYLRRSDIDGGMLSYSRRKTGRRISVRWEGCMQEIVDRYATPGMGFLLPIIVKEDVDTRTQYRSALRLVNNRLKRIAEIADLGVRLTMYVSRHSWASIAKSQNIPLSVISEGLGHDSPATTLIYLAALDHSEIDKANESILKKL